MIKDDLSNFVLLEPTEPCMAALIAVFMMVPGHVLEEDGVMPSRGVAVRDSTVWLFQFRFSFPLKKRLKQGDSSMRKHLRRQIICRLGLAAGIPFGWRAQLHHVGARCS